ncbi:hypothetical protein [Actinomadura sp. 6N118]|uniref:hypothetical protein n=1 Tax=Actinomadura sp. 6N118 TaxID=3375151 RepID=UPI0037AF23A8
MKLSRIMVTGLLTAAVTTITAAGTPAGATPLGDAPTGTVTAKPGAHNTLSANVIDRPAAAPEPTTSPTVPRQFIPDFDTFPCAHGNACASAIYGNGAYLFTFFRYASYGLSNWFGTGSAFNNQSGGAAMRLEDNNHRQLNCIPAGKSRYVDWTPVWFIRLTASPC